VAADVGGAGGRVLAVDVGGTKLAVGVVDTGGEVVRQQRRPTPATSDPEALWAELARLVDDVLGGEDVDSAGVGCGGPMRWPAGEVSPLSIPAWRGFPLRARLSAHLGRPVRLHNDAICLAAAEHWQGAARGHDHALGMVVSTNVGGGLILGGRLVDGASGNAGHVGHVVVDRDGPPCSCGGRGCLSAVACGPAIATWARDRGWRGETAAELAEAARAGDELARAAFDRAGTALGVALASVAAVCDITVAVLGGGVMDSGDLVMLPTRKALAAHAALGFTCDLTVARSPLAHAGLVGAAALQLGGTTYWSPGAG
jgi:glucokinase